MKIDAETYQKLPEYLKALFQKSPNPSSEEVLAGFPSDKSGGAARFFYCAKASKKDRNEGCEGQMAEYHLNNDAPNWVLSEVDRLLRQGG